MKYSGKKCLFVATVLAAVCVAGTAGRAVAAEDEAVVKVLPFKVAGDGLDQKQARGLTDIIVAKIGKYPKFKALPVPEQDPLDMMVDAGCTDFDAECLALIGGQSGADQVLHVEVTREGDSFKVAIKFVEVKSRAMKSPEGETSSIGSLPGFLGKSLEGVFGPEPKLVPTDVLVNFVSKPAGAEVYIGQDFMGVAPVMLKLKPGEYNARATKSGYNEKVGTFKVDGAKENLVEWTLEAAPVPVPAPEPAVPVQKQAEVGKTPFYKTWWFWTIVGVVVVGAGTAAGVLASQGDSANGRVGFSPDSYFAPMDVTLYR